MSTTIKNTFVGVLAATLMFAAFATPVKAQTVAELQAAINALMAQLNAMTGTTTTATSCTTFGLPGVMGVQQAVNQLGYAPALIADGKIGPKTKAGVVWAQAKLGVTADGAWGPATNAAYTAWLANCSTGTTTTTTTTTTPGSLSGGAGDINVTKTSVDTESDVSEGSTEKVLAFRVEAEDSDVQVTNLKVTLENQNTASSNRRPDRYLSEISVWMGDTKVGSIDPMDMTRGSGSTGDEYSRNISLSNAVVKEGAANRATFFVAFKALNNIDSIDMQYADFDLDVDNIRFVDGSGSIMTASDTVSVEGIKFEDPSSAGDVRLRTSLGSNNPSEGSVEVNEFSSTSNITLLEFRLKAEGMDMDVEEINVALVSAVSDLDDILADVKLMRGSSTLADFSGPFNTSTTQTISFDLYDDLRIEEGDTETLKVVAKLLQQDGNFTSGATLKASAGSIVAEDQNGNQISNFTGSAAGFAQTLFVDGAEIEFVSTTSQATNDNNTSRDFTLVFDVTAIGKDLTVDRTSLSSSTNTGVQYAITGGSVTSTASLTSNAALSTNTYTVYEGQTRRFTLTVNMVTSSTGQKRFTLEKVGGVATTSVIESDTATVNQ